MVVRRSDNGGIFLICRDVCESLSVFQQTIAVRAGVVYCANIVRLPVNFLQHEALCAHHDPLVLVLHQLLPLQWSHL